MISVLLLERDNSLWHNTGKVEGFGNVDFSEPKH